MSRAISLLVFTCLLPLLFAGFDLRAGEKVWQTEYWQGYRRPMIEMNYTFGSFKHKSFDADLPEFGAIELRLGYFRSRPMEQGLGDLQEKFLFGVLAKNSYGGSTIGPGDLDLRLARFGFGTREGYAYDLKGSYLFPYHQTSWVWSQLKSTRPNTLTALDLAILDRYEGMFRFGAATEGGLAFGIGDAFAVKIGYEAAAIYPRFVFWKWLGSYALAGVGMELVSEFADEIVESAPEVGPIIYALLRSGLAYGYYLGVRDRMSWPFRSEMPMTTEGIKVGVSLTF